MLNEASSIASDACRERDRRKLTDLFTWSGEKFVKGAISVSISTRVTMLSSGDEGSLEGGNYKTVMTANNRKLTCSRPWIRAICHFLFPVRRDLEWTCSLVTRTLFDRQKLLMIVWTPLHCMQTPDITVFVFFKFRLPQPRVDALWPIGRCVSYFMAKEVKE